MKAWWSTLSPRDRRVLRAGAGVVALLLLWTFAVEPLRVAREDWTGRVLRAEASAAWMREAARQLAALPPVDAAVIDDDRSLLARADAAAREVGLGGAITRIEPEADGVRAQLQDAGYDALARWLDALESSGAAAVVELSIQRAAAPGRVDARVRLQDRRAAGRS